jgi:flavodoxin
MYAEEDSMSTLIIYDSEFGNTAKIAHALAVGAAEAGKVIRKTASEVSPADLYTVDLVLVGSPTQGGQPTEAVAAFLDKLSNDVVRNVRVATFDTRFALDAHGRWLKFVMKRIGFAAPQIAAKMVEKGAKLISQPEGFIVHDKKGPLEAGELERARLWSRNLAVAAH